MLITNFLLMNNSPADITQLSEFGSILLFMLGSLVFVAVALFVARLLRPARPNVEKLTSYECGEDPVSGAWNKFNVRFYVVALIFVLFEVELVFLFPWATVFGQKALIKQTGGAWGWFSLAEMIVFVAMLAVGLAYTWRKGHLDWIKPEPVQPVTESPVPMSVYENFNRRMEQRKEAKEAGK